MNKFIGLEDNYEDSNIILFGVPFDGTASYRPGSRFAPESIRNESYSIETYSPYLDKDLCEINACDFGDLEIPFGNTKKVLDIVSDFVTKILEDKKFPFMIGGEHLITLGAVRAVFKKHPNLHIVHFDAHTDLRNDYLGETLSHATVIRRCHDLVGDDKIFQFGIRSGEKEEFIFAQNYNFIQKFNFNGIENILNTIKNNPVYFTLDLDVLDPSEFPGTGTPEAGGVHFPELLEALKTIFKLNIVGLDVNELSPHYDSSGISTSLSCKIIRELLLYLN